MYPLINNVWSNFTKTIYTFNIRLCIKVILSCQFLEFSDNI